MTERHELIVIAGLVIDYPAHGQSVARYVLAKGKVSDPFSRVWLVVHPSDSFRYWVQPKIQPDEEGNWQGQIYIGSIDPAESGIRFEIRAFANPMVMLSEGAELFCWPEAQQSSVIVEVVRT